MTNLKTVLTETLADHEAVWAHNIDMLVRCDCGYGHDIAGYDHDMHADHQAEMILGLSGVAVTQLPEPVGTNGNDNRVWSHSPNYIEQEFEGDVIINDRLGIDADHLRDIGAIFLAAAAGVFSEGATND